MEGETGSGQVVPVQYLLVEYNELECKHGNWVLLINYIPPPFPPTV